MLKPSISVRDGANVNEVRLSVCFDDSASGVLRRVMLLQDNLFVETDAAQSDVIVFGSDEQELFNHHPLFAAYPAKCICISETDIPTFRIPALYAANEQSLLARSRTATINYCISERGNPNPEVKRLIGQQTTRRYLYSFMGGTNSWARRRLFRAVQTGADTMIEATDRYNHWTESSQDRAARANLQRRYAEVIASSKYALCPRGCGLSSYRLFEAMSLSVAPVIISDRWQPTRGIDWSFAIFLPEKRIAEIDKIIRAHEDEWEDRGRAAASTYQKHFGDTAIAETLHRQIVDLLSAYNPRREAVMQVASQLRTSRQRIYWMGYGKLKHAVLTGYKLAGVKFPFRLHSPIDDPNQMDLSKTSSD
jgi:hypothetical protein